MYPLLFYIVPVSVYKSPCDGTGGSRILCGAAAILGHTHNHFYFNC